MNTLFECGIRYDKIMVNGSIKKITEPYIVNATTFTEAEANITKEVFVDGCLDVMTIKRVNYNEIFVSDNYNDDKWFCCKITLFALDENSGKEKKTKSKVLVQASDLNDAKSKLDKHMSESASEYVVNSVIETPIVDVFN